MPQLLSQKKEVKEKTHKLHKYESKRIRYDFGKYHLSELKIGQHRFFFFRENNNYIIYDYRQKKVNAIEDKAAWFKSIEPILIHNYRTLRNNTQAPNSALYKLIFCKICICTYT
jgi:hypothetical protein